MIKQRAVLKVKNVKVAYTVFKKETSTSLSDRQSFSKRSLLLLHGAGVAGELTWTFIVNYLTHWDEILVPDLLGMGDSFFDDADAEEFSIQDVCASLISLLRDQQCFEFDLVGYSLGGLVAVELNNQANPDFIVGKMCLIEPALFNDASLKSAIDFRRLFVPLVANIKAQPCDDQPFVDFLNLVSPHRKSNPQVDKLAIKRLQKRPLGFANALNAVSEYAEALDESSLHQLIAAIPAGLGIIGGLSSPSLLAAQQMVQRHQPQWAVEILPDTDHGLVYVRPKKVAQLLNQYLY